MKKSTDKPKVRLGAAAEKSVRRQGPPPRQISPRQVRGEGDTAPRMVSDSGEGERLQKVLAFAGLGSRRACEELIAAGRVTVDGRIVDEMGTRVDPKTAVIHVDGSRVVIEDDNLTYLAMNKPVGVLSSMAEDDKRFSVGDYVKGRETRVFHVGRLDAESEGLLLLTNDGALAHRLTHPSFGVQKTYLAEVPGPMKFDVKKRLLAGVELEDGMVKVDSFRVVDNLPGKILVEVVLHEGRKHVVRRLLEEVGHPVSKLVRTSIGPLLLGALKPGGIRRLSQQEISALYDVVEL